MSAHVVHPLTGATRGALFLGLMTMGIGMTVMFAVVPPLGRDAGLNEVEVSLVLSVSALFYAVLTPVWARLADQFGRKRIIVFALAAGGFSNMAFAAVIWLALEDLITPGLVLLSFILVRLLFGILAPGLNPAAMAMVTDASDERSRAASLGTLGAAMGVGSVLGPGLAAVLAPLGRVAPLWGAASMSLLVAVLAFALVTESRTRTVKQADAPKLPLTHPSIAPFLILMMMYFLALAGFQQTFAFMVQDQFALETSKAAQSAGIGFTVLAVSSLVTQFGYINVFRPAPAVMLRRGLVLVTLAYVGLACSESFWMIWLSLAIAGIGAANTVPGANALASLRAPAGLQGSAAGLMASAPPAGFVIGPILGALLYQVDIHLPLWFAAAACAVLFLFSLRLKAE